MAETAAEKRARLKRGFKSFDKVPGGKKKKPPKRKLPSFGKFVQQIFK